DVRTAGRTRMSDPMLIESDERLAIRSPMRAGMRVLLVVLAAFPLVAPYELLVRIDWQYHIHPFFFLAAFISAGAIALSAFFVFAAITGLNSEIVFDSSSSTLTHSFEAPVIRRARHTYPLSAISNVETAERDWSDSSPTYHLQVVLDDGTVIESGSSWSRDDVEAIRIRVERFMAG
ncbi:MAG: hypothetical protein U1E29_05805, partial [Coriobacteriia bacterium]|nr:hypothetical protein [Coriobacteriia bacterium]